MASSSSTFSMLDEHLFRTMFNQNLYEELVSRKKITPEVTFDLEDDEYPSIKEQIVLREMEQADQHPYKSYVRGVEVDFSPENIRRVLRFKEQTPGAETDYTTHLNSDQRLDELRRAELTPVACGWHEFVIHSIIATGNKSEITIARAILIHAIIKGEDVRVEELIADNIAVIAQGMQGKGKLAFPSTIFKLCKDAQVPMREFKRSELIPQDKLITARLMETTRLARNV
ncbi:hypothetical protein PIB30_089089 [Stylosanthes scabra]|uniref:Putative plant transposon protein domain-containing protein n=1 Tax=Stylosanthes scabra TaxID=79078 RepID=A0ABU6TUL3_9FABA|nr:hypothetical protein [Stylosanthes scabra]